MVNQHVERIARRFLAAVKPSQLLSLSLQELEKGNPEPTKQALMAALAFLRTSERPREIGSTWSIDADWAQALGRQQYARVRKVVQQILDLRRWVSSNTSLSVKRDLGNLVKDLQWAEMQARTDEDAKKHGPFTVTQMAGVSRENMLGALQALDAAANAISHKFPQLVYGKVFISPRLPVASISASYVPKLDAIYLSMKAQKTVGDVYALVHEFGHRFWDRFWRDSAAKQEFIDLSEIPEFEVIKISRATKLKWVDDFLLNVQETKQSLPVTASDPLMLKMLSSLPSGARHQLRDLTQSAIKGGEKEEKIFAKGFLDIIPDEIRTDKIVRQPLKITPYGGTNPQENFAEAFAFYVLGKPLPKPILNIMKRL